MSEGSGKKIFVIYGRNADAYRELRTFLDCIGADEVTFEQVANLQTSPYITEIVYRGIQHADAVIVLLTPDELSVLYQAHSENGTGQLVAGSARWQARPNVIFEAGIAFGVGRDKTVIAALGGDITGFSDISGVHLVRLDGENGKKSLFDRLKRVLTGLNDNWEQLAGTIDFQPFTPKRWPFHDELQELELFLSARRLIQKPLRKRDKKFRDTQRPVGPYSLMEIVQWVVKHETQNWKFKEPLDFMKAVRKYFSRKVTNRAYWWLVVAGVFQFYDIEIWFESGESWKDSVAYTKFSARGLALTGKIVAVA